jgi:hypothetical protein
MADPCLPVAVDAGFSEVLCIRALLSPAGGKARTGGGGADGQEKNETKRFQDSLFSSGNFLAGAGGRQIEMLRLNELGDGFMNLQFTKGTLPE